MMSEKSAGMKMDLLKVSNDLLGDRKELANAWERDGYWFFQDVLDLDAVARFRSVYRRELAELGYCAADDETVRYNGAPLDNFPMRMEPLAQRQTWKLLMAEPAIQSFFEKLLGSDPFWLPIAEYRATPPTPGRTGTRLEFIHQDAMYNSGISFRVCWVPLVDIDAEVGGIVVAEGMHRQGLLHKTSGLAVDPITAETIPAERWRRAGYRAGDVLLMDQYTPHSGLSNLSDRFRLSLDIRLALEDRQKPAIGRLVAVGEDQVMVHDGRNEHIFLLNDATFCRDSAAHRIARSEVPQYFQVGDEVIVAAEDRVATVLRHVH